MRQNEAEGEGENVIPNARGRSKNDGNRGGGGRRGRRWRRRRRSKGRESAWLLLPAPSPEASEEVWAATDGYIEYPSALRSFT